MPIRRILLIVSLFISILITGCSSIKGQSSNVVLSSLAPIHALTSSLTKDSDITVENIPQQARSMSSQQTFFSRQASNFAERFKTADAVITIGKLWEGDAFYTAAREYNIHIVNVDATEPWSNAMSGISIKTYENSSIKNPYYWLSIGNVIRSLNIIAKDLQTLYPSQSDIINTNLNREVNRLIQLRTKFELALLDVVDPVVYALTDEFNYLTNELGIFVDGYFIKQDIDWTDDDLRQLSKHLQDNNIQIVLHKWEPSEKIKEAITDAGASLVVLDRLEFIDQDLVSAMNNNLDNLLNAFKSIE